MYASGAVAGAVLLRYVRRKLGRLPVVGAIARPLLALVPVTLLGAAAGAGAVYCVEEGDISAIRRKLLPSVRRHASRAADEAAALAAQVQRDAAQLSRENERAVRELARTGARLAAEAERTLTPALKREIEAGRRDVARGLQELEAAAVAAAREVEHAHARRGVGGSSNVAWLARGS